MACAQAVELGDVAVRSHIGQPLVADIELTGFSGADIPVDVRLARPDVYLGAGIAMHPVLQNLRMSVMRRDGRQFLHITSTAVLDAQYIHLFLDLSDAGRHSIRTATLWLTPDPKPAPAPVPVPIVAPAVAPVVAKAEPPKAAPRPTVVRAPAAVVAAPAAACPKPRYSDEQVRACAARDYKSAVLTAQLVELEDKVKVLQASLDPGPVGGKPADAVKPAPEAVLAPKRPAAPPPIRTIKHKQPEPEAAPDVASAMPRWAWNLIALLAAAGAIAAVVAKRRLKPSGPPSAAAPAKAQGKLIGRLRDALHRDKKPAADAPEDDPGQMAA
ncbi:hypothetical protein D3872_06850 [Massilia cavernae]|uniref:FimV N-terminal domain-containing protein n=2 Tax=Massilia cavernae TaxID=2320864 RepID=A0A418Y563_9BURK|nr:hypothetical protein D3872_06850 [Massilia cavernae]